LQFTNNCIFLHASPLSDLQGDLSARSSYTRVLEFFLKCIGIFLARADKPLDVAVFFTHIAMDVLKKLRRHLKELWNV